MKLTSAEVYRSGRTARTWNYENDKVELDKESPEAAIYFRLGLTSKGGGITEVKVTIGPDDFAAIVSAMLSVDRGRAMSDIASALATEIANQSKFDKKLTHEARESVADAAERAFNEAPAGHDHAERLVMNVVREFVDGLNDADEDTGANSEYTPVSQKR